MKSMNYRKNKPWLKVKPEAVWFENPVSLSEGCLLSGIAFFYALIAEITFLTNVITNPRIKTIEKIFKRISKVFISFYSIIQIFAKGNTFLSIIFDYSS